MNFKKLFLFLLITISISNRLIAQRNEYDKAWKKIEELEKKGLTKSALQEVLKIYDMAVKDNNSAQQIKSSIYQVKYRNMVEEDSRENNVFFIDTLITKARVPAKNILQSMQAEMLWQYLQINRYKFYGRTKLAEEKSKDISTWSLDKLHATISMLYNASLRNDNILKQTKLDAFEPIIIKGINTRELRPTLYDFLAHRALEYFMNDEHDLIKPAWHFTINDSKIFAPVSEFIGTPFITKDTSSLQHKAILILQQILKFHINDANSDALLDADLIRLNFANQYAVNEDKTKLYEAALKNIEERYPSNATTAQAMYLRAAIYYARGQDYDPLTKTDNQYEIKRAKEICDEVIRKFPKSGGAINCQNLLMQIIQPSLNLETEKVNLPDQPFRTLVKYKNARTVHFRLITISREGIKKLDRRNYDKLWKEIVELNPVKSWNVTMPDLQDYQGHSLEIKVDGLKPGSYFILASLDGNFSLQKNIIAKQLIYVSNISYISNNSNEYYVLHRQNGLPLPNTLVQVWQTKYNYTRRENEELKAESYTTDKNGYFKIKESKEYRSFTLQVKTKDEELFMDEGNYTSYYNSYESGHKPVTFLFTDRSIYRPGQMVYFKGIVLQSNKNVGESSVLNSFSTTIQLKDANGQELTKVKMTTNEFGSYHGSFKLPEGSLNGRFSLLDEATSGSISFRVEEYKRPKFFVEIKKPSGTYRLFDSVKVSGAAKAYAGNNIDGAKVTYRVVRKVRYPMWWEWGYSGYGRKIMPPERSSEQTEISNGETTTDSKGEFTITFKALPDESINKKDQPVFYYEVSADITDLNGETRSGNASVAVAYQLLQFEINLPDKLPVDSFKNILVKSTNLNGIEENAIASISIQKLIGPVKIFRERYWQQPDLFIMSREEYYGYFPYDVYKNENEVKNYELGEKVVEKKDSTNSVINIQNFAFTPGWYKIVATTKDKYQEEVRVEKFVQLIHRDASKTVIEPITVDVRKSFVEPGEKISYNISTGFNNIWLIQTLSKMDKTNITTYRIIQSTRPYKNEINVAEADRGGIVLSYAFVQHNRVYKDNKSFEIPWSNKELDISYQTFRDKILPGSEEKWTVKISGKKGEKVAAELLAGMYDASLDKFKSHNWSTLKIWPGLSNDISWTENGFSAVNSEEYNRREYSYSNAAPKSYDRLIPGYESYSRGDVVVTVGYGSLRRGELNGSLSEVVVTKARPGAAPEAEQALEGKVAGLSNRNKNQNLDSTTLNDSDQPATNTNNDNIQVRKNFNETAFFFPDLKTDAEGNVSFGFTIPEALTQWKLMTFAHTKELASGYSEKTVITQKPLMVQPNAPRFMREGDRMEFSSKIANMSDKELTGTIQLELLDAATNKPVDGWFKNVFPTQYFTVAAGQSAAVKFPIEIPFNFNSAMSYRIIAKSAKNTSLGDGSSFSDGEEMALPILINRMLVTESFPLNVRGVSKKDFKFEKLINSSKSNTIDNYALTVEYTSNPAWYAVQALPYLMEYPYECSEQTFNRYYANTLASFVSNSMPKIKSVFEKWKQTDTAALISNLQKNEELKSALLQETPWVMEAQNESQQKKNIALLFDMVRMSKETGVAINKLNEMQSTNGGFVWFKGGPDDRYITQYIITGIGHLKKLNALPGKDNDHLKNIMAMVSKAIPYLDRNIKEDYDELKKNKVDLKNNNLNYTTIQYLYMRSFFTEYGIPATSQAAYTYYHSQAKKYWLTNGKYMQAMIALALHRTNDYITPKAIIRSLKENAINNEELGMYWKELATGGYYWYQAPVESQAMIIEAFMDIDKNPTITDELKTWLLKQKQTQNWRTTKATAEACYALLLGGSNWLNQEKEVVINLGTTVIKSADDKGEAGTGYFKKRIEAEKIKPEMGNIAVNIFNSPTTASSGSWGAVYWQYFEDLDKISTAATPLKLSKKLFKEQNTDKGPVLHAIGEGAILKVGDKIKIRIELMVDRDMEYVHMKDMRAACMEPVNVLSGYKYQGGLGYYESTKDASTNFFFGWLAKGTYIFEYPVFVTHTGNFSNGITSIQCMYAPEFTSHSEGIRINVEAPSP